MLPTQVTPPKTLSYSLDYPVELWSQHKNPAVRAIAELRKHSLELDEMLTMSTNYTWTTTWQTNQNTVRLVIFIEFTEVQDVPLKDSVALESGALPPNTKEAV